MSSEADNRFSSLIDGRIAALVDSAGSLDALCLELPGVFPTEVLRRLESLRRSGAISAETWQRLCSYDPVLIRRLEAASSVLPLPHPLDYEWRFTSRTAITLFELARHQSDQRIALLGTPSIAEWAAQTHQKGAVLFERRADACAAIDGFGGVAVNCIDLAEFRGSAFKFDAVIADPPWYPAVTETFVHVAACLLREGGTLFLCGPGLGTRPDVGLERVHLAEFAHHYGLVLVEVAPGQLRYESPPFELAALGAAGVQGFRSDWRSADLLRFVKNGEPATFIANTDDARSGEWTEVQHGRARIRIRMSTGWNNHTEMPLQPVVPGDVLDSVSRRDSRRAHVQVWTTTNAVYHTSDPARLTAAMRSVTDGQVSQVSKRRGYDRDFVAAATSLLDCEESRLQDLGCG